MIKEKKYSGYLLALLLIVLLFVAIIVYYVIRYRNNETKDYLDEWAFYNCGQVIEESPGVAGIDINIVPAWEITKGDKNVVIGVVDSGVDVNCDIFCNSLLSGWDYYNNDSTIYDDYIYDYHGTYICSMITKVAPQISILPVKFMESTSGEVEDAVLAIQYAIENGASIINCSWNCDEESEQLYNIIKNNPDVLFVCAAGNFNANIDDVKIYPCSYALDNMINVMAVNNQGKPYIASGYGASTVDIAAPGENVKVIIPENDVVYVNGTSVSTAIISAIAGLMLSENEKLTPNEMKNMLIKTTKKVDSLKSLCRAEGIVDAYAALLNCAE